MISFPIGLVLTLGIFIASMGLERLTLYFNLHSIVLVGGGTLTILLLSAPVKALKELLREVLALFRPSKGLSDARPDLLALARAKDSQLQSGDEFLLYAQDLWTQGVSRDIFIVLLSQKRDEIQQRSVEAIQCLKNLAKYPPALGMAGTVMGIVTLFQSLDAGKDKIGPALALALTATFFGLIIANAFVMPVADRLQLRQLSQVNYLNSLYQVLLLINEGESEQLIEDEVKLRAG
jgi:chemotaxis protein MotA